MPDTLRAALLFLINTLFDLYLFVLVIRAILVYVNANYFNPIAQFIAKATDFIIKPMRQYIPNYGRFETSTIVLIIVLEILKFLLISLFSFGFPNILGVLILAFGDALKLLLITFFYAILLQAILSWIQPHASINHTLVQFNAPVMRPFQRVVPLVGGVDISPIFALILLQLLIIILVNPLMAVGLGAALG